METTYDLRRRSTLRRGIANPKSLSTGIPFFGLATAPHRLKITNGTRLAGMQDGNYQAGAILPNPIWRRPDVTELRILKARPTDTKRGFLSVIDCNVPSVTRLRKKLQFTGSTVHSPEYICKLLPNECEEITQELQDHGRLEIASCRCLGVFAGPAGHQTTTVENGTNKKIGLHIDNWSDFPLDDRAKAPSRLCINLGAAPRELLVVNFPVSEIANIQLDETWNTSSSMNLTETGRRFLLAFPSYPVISITMHPLEGYLAPTENMIHDASTLHMATVDISLTILGHFSHFDNTNCCGSQRPNI